MKRFEYPPLIEEVRSHIQALSGNVPLHRRESGRGYSFSGLPFGEQLEIWDKIWRSEDDFWVRLHAYFFLERHLKKDSELREMWPIVVEWQEQVDDWGLCDALAKVYTKILVVMPDEVYGQLKQWNHDTNLWKRRQSVVSLLYYSRTKKQHPSFDEAVRLIEPLLSDKEYYVQKGVGWSLRELHTVYHGKALIWLRAHIKQLSSIAFTIAMEKLDAATVLELKTIRKTK